MTDYVFMGSVVVVDEVPAGCIGESVQLEAGRPHRRRGWQPRIEIVTGTRVPLDYIEVQIRGRQLAKLRKDRLGETKVVSVRAIGSVVDDDPASAARRRWAHRRAA